MTPFAVRVVTFQEAPNVLSALLRGAPVPRSRIVTIDKQKALRIRDGYNALVSAVNAVVRAVENHNHRHPELRIPVPTAPRQTVVAMAELFKYELLGEARGPAKWSAKLVEPRSTPAPVVRVT